MPNEQRPLKVFLCHASQDKPVIRELAQRLFAEGWIDPWLDEKKLLPGQDWRLKIEDAVETSDIVIICLSSNSVTKEGFVQKELRYAREIALEKPDETIFLIPLRLDDCEAPRGLRFYQWVDYFGDKKNEAYSALIESLKLRHGQKLVLEVQERILKEKLERVHEAAEKLAQANAIDDKETKEKVRTDAEDQVGQREAKEKAKVETSENPRPQETQPKSVDQKPASMNFQEISKELEAQQARSGSHNQMNLWVIGLATLILGTVLLFTFNNRINAPEPTATNTLFPTGITETLISNIPPTPTDAVLPIATALGGGAGKIIFEKSENEKNGIYIVNVDGSELKKLTDGQYNESVESLSPNGEKVLFSSRRDDGLNFYVMDVDGKNKVKLTNTSIL